MSVSILLLFLLLFFIIIIKKNKWASLLVLTHIVSIGAGLLIDYRFNFSWTGLLWTFLICFYLYLIIAPWKYLKISGTIANDFGANFNLYSKIMIGIGLLSVLFFTPVVIVISQMDVAVNDFKYEGVIDDFFESGAFPIPFKLFILITFFANFSILVLPLHFYYLVRGENKMALLALIASFAYVMRGLTYFSRAVPLQYIMLYGMFFLLFYKEVPKKTLKTIKIIGLIGVTGLLINMMVISNDRFEEYYSFNQTEYKINKEKYISDPVIVSYVDYLSMGYYNCYDLLGKYDGHTFKGQTTFGELLQLLHQYLGVPFSKDEYQNLREKLWPGLWSKSFNGYVAYVVYDFGVVLSFIITMLYYMIVKRFCKKRRKDISLSHLTWLCLLLQIPLFSIFYSVFGQLVLTSIFFFVLNIIFGKHKATR